MILRKSFLPKTIKDCAVTSFVAIIIPIVYWFELFIVIPTFCEQWTGLYLFHFILGTFILLNIITNFLGIILCDTSIKGKFLLSTIEKNWRFCSVCECIAPPRSWHCNTCNTCILKRDHHCIFTGCCIGHFNLRYFIMFVFYIFAATVYASYFNLFYIYNFVELHSWISFVKLIFPLAMLFVQYSSNQLFLFLILIITIGCLFTGILFVYHTNLILKGMVTNELKYKLNKYNLGLINNIKVVLGERWYISWISPFVASALTHDGIMWVAKESQKVK